jgi:hypothetical protein
VTSKQLSILNSLVTFAAENIPGGLSEDEREVARIVGAACLVGNDIELGGGNQLVPCTCSEDRQAGDPEDHAGHCLWAIANMDHD